MIKKKKVVRCVQDKNIICLFYKQKCLVKNYLASSVQYYENHYKASPLLTEYIIEKLINQNKSLINNVIENLGTERFLLCHLKKNPYTINFSQERQIFNEIMNNSNILKEIKKNIHVKDNILSDIEEINNLSDKNSIRYKSLYNQIINVDEFKNNVKIHKNLLGKAESHY
jgi:archaellum biogenesis ATPase FlaH